MRRNEMNPIVDRVRKNLSARRKQVGLSQQQLADAIGLSVTAVRFWEAGRREIHSEYLLQVAAALGKSWLWFYQHHDDEELSKPVSIGGLTAQELAAIRLLISQQKRTGTEGNGDGPLTSVWESDFLQSLTA